MSEDVYDVGSRRALMECPHCGATMTETETEYEDDGPVFVWNDETCPGCGSALEFVTNDVTGMGRRRGD